MSNFFFSPPAYLCAVTYITAISLHRTLSNISHSHSLSYLVLSSDTNNLLLEFYFNETDVYVHINLDYILFAHRTVGGLTPDESPISGALKVLFLPYKTSMPGTYM